MSLFPKAANDVAVILNKITAPIWDVSGVSGVWGVFGSATEQTVRCYSGPSHQRVGVPRNQYEALFKTMISLGIFDRSTDTISLEGPDSYTARLCGHSTSDFDRPVPSFGFNAENAPQLARFLRNNQKEISTRLRAFTNDPGLSVDTFSPLPQPAPGFAALQKRWSVLLKPEQIISGIKRAIERRLGM